MLYSNSMPRTEKITGAGPWRLYFGVGAALLLSLAPALLAYTSQNVEFLGRYSAPYAGILCLYLLAALSCSIAALLPGSLLTEFWSRLAKLAASWLPGPAFLAMAVLLPWAIFLTLAIRFVQVELGRDVFLHSCGAAAALWFSLGPIFVARTGTRARARAMASYVIFCSMGGLLFILVEVFLHAKPGILPIHLMYSLPANGSYLQDQYLFEKPVTIGFRFKPGTHHSNRMMASEANLYIQQPDLVRPLPREEDRVLMETSFTTDANGYRNASPLEDTYPIVVSGDSVTSLSVEPAPWPERLADKTGQAVLNLAIQGYGPQSEAEALIRFGLPKKPQWVLVAYFEGNDLANAQDFELKKRSGLGWMEYDLAEAGILERSMTFHVISYAWKRLLEGPVTRPAGAGGGYPYPFDAELDGRNVSLTFSKGYLSTLSLSRQEVESLDGFREAKVAIHRLHEQTRAAGAQLLIVYCPTKEHCYVPFLPEALLSTKLAGPRKARVSSGLLHTEKRPVTAAELLANLDGQRDAVLGWLEREGIQVLDLTPALQEAAARGEQLYWTNDTHWNPIGNELAATMIAHYLESNSE